MPSLVVTSSILDRYDVHSLELGHIDCCGAADGARLRSIRRRVVARLDGHLRLGRRGRLAARLRPAETPPPKNQLPTGWTPSPPPRIAFHPSDPNYMSTFHQDGTDVQILDMWSPGAPMMDLRAHRVSTRRELQ